MTAAPPDYEGFGQRYDQTWLNSQDPAPRPAIQELPPAPTQHDQPVVVLNASPEELEGWSGALADVQCWFHGFEAAVKLASIEVVLPRDFGGMEKLRKLKIRLDELRIEPSGTGPRL